ncbi:hypothetical protein [Paracoccus lutimaris]|uniref:hypothetical protein n=1 Tax=Paracoccus lutimaris TaxID=1490030 RepID=UPI0011C0390A|nr:hypothetical protein [Paracoccus lutimaris]
MAINTEGSPKIFGRDFTLSELDAAIKDSHPKGTAGNIETPTLKVTSSQVLKGFRQDLPKPPPK